MKKKYIVRLSQEERAELRTVIKKLVGASQKVRRAQILLKADADGPYWTDSKIADAYGCRSKTVGNLRQSLVNEGFQTALNGKKRAGAPIPKKPDFDREARIIATRLGPAPRGFANWSLRLSASQRIHVLRAACGMA